MNCCHHQYHYQGFAYQTTEMKRISCFLYKHKVQEPDLERTKCNLSATSCLKILFLSKDTLFDNFEFLQIKAYVVKDILAECRTFLCLKKGSTKLSFLNIHKIASYLYVHCLEYFLFPSHWLQEDCREFAFQTFGITYIECKTVSLSSVFLLDLYILNMHGFVYVQTNADS